MNETRTKVVNIMVSAGQHELPEDTAETIIRAVARDIFNDFHKIWGFGVTAEKIEALENKYLHYGKEQ